MARLLEGMYLLDYYEVRAWALLVWQAAEGEEMKDPVRSEETVFFVFLSARQI